MASWKSLLLALAAVWASASGQDAVRLRDRRVGEVQELIGSIGEFLEQVHEANSVVPVAELGEWLVQRNQKDPISSGLDSLKVKAGEVEISEAGWMAAVRAAEAAGAEDAVNRVEEKLTNLEADQAQTERMVSGLRDEYVRERARQAKAEDSLRSTQTRVDTEDVKLTNLEAYFQRLQVDSEQLKKRLTTAGELEKGTADSMKELDEELKDFHQKRHDHLKREESLRQRMTALEQNKTAKRRRLWRPHSIKTASKSGKVIHITLLSD